ncbi:MAG: oligosaccharide flippase family protein, partial [Dehalococcoidales bacterium]|nr:oligosaccharide flippase family protein [Dehalococcoidales bacterium]
MLGRLKAKYQSLPLIVRASLWFIFCSFMQKGITLLTTPIFTRLMSTAEYGQFSVFNSWYSIVEVFVSLELSKGVYSQGIVKFSEDQKVFSSTFQGLNFALLLFWTIIYWLFRGFFNQLLKLTTVQMLCMLAMIWACAAYALWATEKQTNFNYRSVVIVTLLTSILKPLVGILLVLKAADKVTARIFGLMLVEVIAYSGLCIVQILRGKKLFSKKYWIYAISFNIPLIPHYLSQIVLDTSDRIMIDNLVSSSA